MDFERSYRSSKMLQMLKDQERLETLNSSASEVTKGTQNHHRERALAYWKNYSEYLSSVKEKETPKCYDCPSTAVLTEKCSVSTQTDFIFPMMNLSDNQELESYPILEIVNAETQTDLSSFSIHETFESEKAVENKTNDHRTSRQRRGRPRKLDYQELSDELGIDFSSRESNEDLIFSHVSKDTENSFQLNNVTDPAKHISKICKRNSRNENSDSLSSDVNTQANLPDVDNYNIYSVDCGNCFELATTVSNPVSSNKEDDISLAAPVRIEASSNKTKLYFCVYCKTKVSRFARHLESKHQCEEKVAEFLKLPKGDGQRVSIINQIRNYGTFEYNTNINLNDGDVLVARRPQSCKKRNPKDYTPCPKCKNFFRKNLLYRHYKRCGNTISNNAPRTLQALSRATLYDNTSYCKWLRNDILPGMTQDEITHIVSHDKLILAYGNYLCMRHDGDKHLTNMVRQKMRQLGRFLICIKKIDQSIQNLESIYHPAKYDNFVKAVRLCSGYNAASGSYRAASLPIAIGTLVKECAEKLLVEFVKERNEDMSACVQSWLSLYRIEYPLINKRAHQIIRRNKWNKPRILPITEDIHKLNIYLQSNFEQTFQLLQCGFDKAAWTTLTKCVLLLILIFNRKRVGEMEKLLIEDYKKRHNIQVNSESYESLTESEKLFSKRYMRVEVRGKLGRPVCLMISNIQVEAINLILKHRENANVQFDNPYVFGRGEDKYFEGARCLREAADACGAKQPHLLRGTKLRKHIATVSQALNLTENELAILADFMGHNIDIHRNFYRLPNEAIHLAKISQLLYALDSNMLHLYKGKSLDEINIENMEIDNVYETLEMSDTNVGTPTKSISYNDEIFVAINEAPNKINVTRENFSENYSSPVILPSTSRKSISYDDDIFVDKNETPNKNNMARENFPENCTSPVISPSLISDQREIYNNKPEICTGNDKLRYTAIWTPNRQRKKAPKTTWKTPEKYAMRRFFSNHLISKKLPNVTECKEAKSKNSSLRNRTIMQIKFWVHNEIKKRKINFDA